MEQTSFVISCKNAGATFYFNTGKVEFIGGSAVVSKETYEEIKSSRHWGKVIDDAGVFKQPISVHVVAGSVLTVNESKTVKTAKIIEDEEKILAQESSKQKLRKEKKHAESN